MGLLDVLARSSLDRRVQRLEALEALRQLKYRYFAAADANYDGDAVAALFTERGVWDGGPVGRYEGREAIRTAFNEGKFSFARVLHYGANPIIDVAGDEAICRWYLWLVKIAPDRSHATTQVGTYHDRCRRWGDGWLFTEIKLEMELLPPVKPG